MAVPTNTQRITSLEAAAKSLQAQLVALEQRVAAVEAVPPHPWSRDYSPDFGGGDGLEERYDQR